MILSAKTKKVLFGIILSSLFSIIINSPSAHAESYLCVTEATAGVEHGVKHGIQAKIYNETSEKYIISNESGEWVVKKLGSEIPIFDKCTGQNFCEMKSGYGGAFIRDLKGFFTITRIFGPASKTEVQVFTMIVAKGRCSKI